MENQPIFVKAIYHVPIDKVWAALTENEQLRKWYFQLEEFKPEIGFTFEFSGGPDEGPQYVHQCEVIELVPGRKIAYTWRYKGYAGNSEVTWALSEDGDFTKLVLSHSGTESFASGGANFTRESFTGGWNYFANDALKKYLEQLNKLL
ncbi:SRPBCC family protein [Pedobacter sp. AW1-32]|uniref:SRPBCC family protein n=1 Tax=Pedobacter sp. AW1-32 TaxID=3383026 RepID=UPI003FED937C